MHRVRRLTAFPRHQLIGHELLRCRASELGLLQRLGSPTAESDPRRHEPRFFWDLAWDCGLLTSVAFHQLGEELSLHLDQPEVDHALRHLGLDPDERWLWEEAEPARFAAAVRRLPARTWGVWQVLPGGLRLQVGAGITERAAWCLAGDLEEAAAEADDPATYLVAPTADPPTADPPVTPSATPPAG